MSDEATTNTDAITENVANRKSAEALFASMLDAARDDFQKLSPHGRRAFVELAHDHFAKKLSLPCGQPKPTPPADQPATPKRQPSEAENALEQCEEILSMCDEVPEPGEDFAESVREGVQGVMETIERTGRVTANQWTAIDNWHGGVARWLD